MKTSNRRSKLYGLLTLICVAALMIGSPQTTSADTAQAVVKEKGTLSKLAAEHTVVEVREAITKIRQGDYAAGVPVLQKYADKNDIGAAFVLAKLHRAGLGVEKSDETAADYLQANVDAGHAPSLIALGEIREKSDPAEAFRLYKKATGSGSPMGNVKLGYIFENGLLGKRANPKLAFINYEKAAKAENAIGYYHLARCYDKGIGTSPNALLATRTFRKSAMQGVASAQVTMAKRYHEGNGLEQDPIAAFGWLTLAAQSGSTEAMILLGRRYETGDIIPQNLDLAGRMYSKAAKRDDPTGRFYLALLYANGKGTKQDLVRAYMLLHESAKSLPMAKEALDNLEPKLSEPQMAEAKKRIAEADAKEAG